MSRENRRKRDARRFGAPERFVDVILGTPADEWATNSELKLSRATVLSSIETLQRDIATAPVIVADNASHYFFEHPREYWIWREDFPTCAPPFPKFFIEFRRPDRVVVGTKILATESSAPEFSGFLFEARDVRGVATPTIRHADPGAPGHVQTMEINPLARWLMCIYPLYLWTGRPVGFSPLMVYFTVSATGEILHEPVTVQAGLAISQEHLQAISDELHAHIMPAVFTVCLMNCKNTAVQSVARDPVHNRERKKAGLKPLVRYHTIEVVPFSPRRSARRSAREWDAAGGDAGRALHIARGHFATYTAELPLFGKHVGTFWVPSHVRGNIKQGVVVSDYDIKAPH